MKDPDGYTFEIIQRASTPEPFCQVMLRVGDLERSIKFYEKVMSGEKFREDVMQVLFIHSIELFIITLSSQLQ